MSDFPANAYGGGTGMLSVFEGWNENMNEVTTTLTITPIRPSLMHVCDYTRIYTNLINILSLLIYPAYILINLK